MTVQDPLNSAKFYVFNGVGYSTNAWSVGNSSGTIRGRLTTSGSRYYKFKVKKIMIYK